MLNSSGNIPGNGDAIETEEVQVTMSGRNNQTMIIEGHGRKIKSTVVDAGNTPTTTLRGGNLLGIKASDGNLYLYDPDGTDGTQLPVGVLEHHQSTLQNGVATDRWVTWLRGGILKVGELLGLDYHARAVLLRMGFKFDSQSPDGAAFLVHHRKVQQTAVDVTVVAADNGDLFVATAAATFTLPTKEHGLSFEFLQTADANMIVASAGSADDIIADGDAGADTLTFSTASHKIGSRVRLNCIYVGANLRWIAENLGGTAMTVA
jgi:hypothetical protein